MTRRLMRRGGNQQTTGRRRRRAWISRRTLMALTVLVAFGPALLGQRGQEGDLSDITGGGDTLPIMPSKERAGIERAVSRVLGLRISWARQLARGVPVIDVGGTGYPAGAPKQQGSAVQISLAKTAVLMATLTDEEARTFGLSHPIPLTIGGKAHAFPAPDAGNRVRANFACGRVHALVDYFAGGGTNGLEILTGKVQALATALKEEGVCTDEMDAAPAAAENRGSAGAGGGAVAGPGPASLPLRDSTGDDAEASGSIVLPAVIGAAGLVALVGIGTVMRLRRLRRPVAGTPQAIGPSSPAGLSCGRCGTPVPAAARYCPTCGTSQPARCANSACGRIVPASAAFCPFCGAAQRRG